MNLILKVIQFPFVFFISLLWSSKDQRGDPRYEAWLNRYGYEAQNHAYLKAQGGSNEGFVYKDPGDMPKNWEP
jgi:hypothetical protein